jgi:hypothetical protein
LDLSWIHAQPFIGCMELLFWKKFVTVFGLGLWHGTNNGLWLLQCPCINHGSCIVCLQL